MALNMKIGTWEDAEEYLNRDFPRVHGADPVEWGAIRHRLEVLQWDCPLHVDGQTAESLGFKGIPAPATMIATWGVPPYWQPGDPPEQPGDPPKQLPILVTEIPAPGESMFATNVETEHFQPVYVGDRITSSTRLIDITRKRTRVGDGAFMTAETTYFSQRDERVAVLRLTVFRYTANT